MTVYSNIEVKVIGYLRTALSAESSTATIDVDFVKEDDKSTAVTLQSDTLMFEIDPLGKSGKVSEIVLATSNAANTPVTGRTRFSTNTRGLTREGPEQTGSASRANSWDVGTEVAIATGSMAKMVNKLMAEVGTALEGGGASVQLPVYANATARDAAIPSPSNGELVYQTDQGTVMQFIAGAWANNATGTVVVASTTAAGKVEVATSAQTLAGTDTGETGAPTVSAPSHVAAAVQNSSFNFFADAQANDTYVITPAPAISAYATGQRFIFTANTANTGACTLNVNGKGAKDIVKGYSTALVTGDIAAGQVVEVVYDGTNMVMTSLPNALVAGGDAGLMHTHPVYAGLLTPTQVAAAGASGYSENTITTTATPRLIKLKIKAGDGTYYGGIEAVYEGTTCKWGTYDYGASATAITKGMLYLPGTFANSTGNLIIGTGGNDQTMTFSITSVSATTCVIRTTNTKNGSGAAGNVDIKIGYEIIC